MNTTNIQVTLNNLSAKQYDDIQKLLGDYDTAQTVCGSEEEETTPPLKKRGRPAKSPELTVSENEPESFARRAMKAADLHDEEEDDVEVDADEDDGDQDTLSFDDVIEVVNKYGEKNPAEMKAILLGFNLKNSKELKLHKNKWEPVYKKTMSKLKALKALKKNSR